MYRITLLCVSLVVCANNYQNIPDYALRLEQQVVKYGYPIEVHQIITEDGYILAAYRIPHGLNKEVPENKNKSVVLIAHGLGGSPHNFLVLGKKRAVPYYFADQGMDVWLFSGRGSDIPFKKSHVKLDWNKDSAFWLHSFHELGIYDLAATIDFILKCTGQKKVTLIGHSAGGAEFFALLSEKPEYNQKVKLAITWGSSAILRRVDYPFLVLGTHLGDFLRTVVKFLRMAQVMVPGAVKSTLIEIFLRKPPLWYKVVKYILNIIGSHNSVMMRDEYIPTILSNIPRVSTRELLHFMDNVHNGTFRKYDYGPKGNLKHYGQADPPHYNLSAVTAPIAFFDAEKDGFLSIEDIYECIQKLPNAVHIYKVPFRKFTHTDYIFGYNATELVYEPTYQMIKRIDSGIIPPRVEVPPGYH
ncbi:unnamed protein product [Ceutorhynchus assimilis]|uniref:Lipase n=1 Tax=Ceutorhynchus assimilis TaxID=467358 RepID=A0A9N9QQN3_9CUCU|nr:unnamed protein product [Ceutorhynchus assimilis]